MDDKEKFLSIGDNYLVGNDGSLFYIEPVTSKESGEVIGMTETAISNHTPILKEQRTIDNGIEVVEELVFNVRRNYRNEVDTAVTLKDILSNTPNIKFGAACRIFLGRGAKARYSEAMQIQCEKAPKTIMYQRTGYSIIDGERVFLNGGYSVTEEGLTDKYNVYFTNELANFKFLFDRHPERFETLLKALPKTAPVELIYSGLGLSFLTPLNSMLRKLGIEPHFIMYFTGKTGSRKTTMAKLFLNFFGVFDNGTPPPANFRDSPNSIENKFAVMDSCLMLLDDRIPSTTSAIKAQMERVEQSVSRMIGDRSGRSRLNADSTLKSTYVPKCNLIITAEESFSNVGESAIARSISVELTPDDVNLQELSKVQRNANHLNECMGDYIQYLLKNWDSISESIKEKFFTLRDKAQTGGHGRLAECVAHLQLGIMTMCDWLISEEVITTETATEMQKRSWEIFIGLADEQNRRIADEKPVKLFLDAVKELKDHGDIRFAEIGNSNSETWKPIGYKDKDYYYCYPDSIYGEVKKFYAMQDKNFPLGKSALFQQLALDKLIDTDKGQNTKTKRIGEKRPRFLWLRVEALDNREEEND